MSGGREADVDTAGGAAPRRLSDRTAALVERARADRSAADDRFEAARAIAPRLGARPIRPDDADPATDLPEGVAFGFWTPDLVAAGVPVEDVRLELFTPRSDDGREDGAAPVDPGRDDLREVAFRVNRLPVDREGEFHWVAVEGIPVGTRDRLGALYQLVYRTPDDDDSRETDDAWETVRDPLAYSVPFGAFAPAEAYDWPRLDATRPDRDHFASLGTDDEALPTTEDDGLPRVDPATSMLEIHPGTSTEAGSLAALAERFESIARKLRDGEPLAPHERNYAGYDAVQLMPVEPLTQAYERQWYWRPGDVDGAAPEGGLDREVDGETVVVGVERPDQTNWGYDVVVSAFSAANPAILETGRPDELVDFIAACHAMPDPVRVVFDVALGHADAAAAELLPDPFFEGPGMYGLHLDYRQPVVRAVLLELQRRKANFGADGIRIDGAQDFTYHDEETGEQVHDDAFLAEMDRVVHGVAGTEYRPWMIYEDGRPWPREDWELASTYRTLIEQHPHAFQWSPVTFAHNKPALLTFWATKWWRMREVGEMGSQWITGVANHDTLRRGSQVEVTDDWGGALINPYLADSPPETIREAYDSPAALVWFHVAMSGVPMDFLHANYRAPWGFVRDTDPTWNAKVVAEEAPWIDWHVPEGSYAERDAFPRLKALGFETRAELKGFVTTLAALVDATDYDLDLIAELLSVRGTPLSGSGDGSRDDDAPSEDERSDADRLTAADLQAFSFAWSADVAEYLTLDRWEGDQDEARTAFDRRVREFRQARPWLRADVDPDRGEAFGYRHPTEGTVVYQALRRDPDGDEALLVACNVEGTPVEVSPTSVLGDLGVEGDRGGFDGNNDGPTGWTVALAAPGTSAAPGDQAGPITLETADAVVWRTERGD
ncbi:glucosylglycerol hydrolase [Halorubrum sp. AD140]|uniref:glucosylglycerol hydrolase n=1 Tax=Halorubrum sp. AD140 TaxID=3050073 RepID=UPI002ACD1DF8|nr:glucosylglycerol hydrolase [Halorubrum sp. AD140]MDZ5811679.1 glucosylglycerol hydrolase [Halorubrum sp. AD140]